jgi:hypothetical protein
VQTASSGFDNAERLRERLEYTVREAIGGRGSWLKESVLGVAIFGRKPGYDSEANSIVRVEFARLRKKLEQYYETAPRNPYESCFPREAMRLNSSVWTEPRKLPLQAAW